jgi:hypothetical protein
VCDILTLFVPLEGDDDASVSARKTVVISARVHPGESSSSWTTLGFLRQLLSGSEESTWLLRNFVIKVLTDLLLHALFIQDVTEAV